MLHRLTQERWREGQRKERHVPTVLTRDKIKVVDDRKIEFVPVPEWAPADAPDAGVYVRGLSGTDRDAFEMAMIIQRRDKKGRTTQEVNLQNLRAKLVVRTAVTTDDPETAEEIFTLEDIEWLGEKSGAALQRVYAKAQQLSGLSVEDVEELTTELGEAQSDGSGTDSLDTLDTVPSLSASSTSAAESSHSGDSSTPLSQSESAG